jgi:hypothetical protein
VPILKVYRVTEGVIMRLTQLRGDDSCPDGRTCPAVHQTDRGTLMIVGRRVSDAEALAQMAIGEDEIAIEVPAGLLPEVVPGAG